MTKKLFGISVFALIILACFSGNQQQNIALIRVWFQSLAQKPIMMRETIILIK